MTDGGAMTADDRASRLKLAQAAARENRFEEADSICRDLLGAHADYMPAHGLRGSIAASLGDLALGARMLEEAVAARPANLGLRGSLCDVYRMSCRFDEALALAKSVVREQPRNAAFLASLARVYADRGEFDHAQTAYLAVLAIHPDDPGAHFGIAQLLLARGEFRSGWIEYEWRIKLGQSRGLLPPMNAPMWNGMMIPKGRVLLVGDQGFGDMFLFARYIPEVARRCLEVVVVSPDEVMGLLQGVEGVGQIFSRWPDVPGFAAYSLLSSLPYVLRTEPHTIPATVSYLRPDPAKVARWRDRLAGSPAGKRRVGLAWAGRALHPNNPRRSMALADLHPLASAQDIQWVSLQKTLTDVDRAAMAADWPSLMDFSAELTDFSETAALIANLDLVITVDTAVGHLAGAMGGTAWLMLADPPDWRWMLPPRDDSPWYRTVRLIRQRRPGCWRDVVDSIASALGVIGASQA
jgi:hypothetical protein